MQSNFLAHLPHLSGLLTVVFDGLVLLLLTVVCDGVACAADVALDSKQLPSE
jgi:hypothetical protein